MLRHLTRLSATLLLALGIATAAQAQSTTDMLTAVLNDALSQVQSEAGFDSLSPEQKAARLADKLQDLMPGISPTLAGIIESAVGLSGASTDSLAEAISKLAAQNGLAGNLRTAVGGAYGGLGTPNSDGLPLTGFGGTDAGDPPPDDPATTFFQNFTTLVADSLNDLSFRRDGSGS